MLKTLGKMIIGQASLDNLSGPITIAEYAGKTASFGLVSYIAFLGVVSVSLGVLNLLPLPVLDGGHLMYYLWEGVTKKPISEQVNLWLQKFGLVIVFMMMIIGFFNDIKRHL
jgi:regulator of sigma E protease